MMGQSYSCDLLIEVELTDNPSTFMTFLLRQEEDSLYFEPLAAWHSDLYMLDTQMICEVSYHWNSCQDNSNMEAFAGLEECIWVDKQSP